MHQRIEVQSVENGDHGDARRDLEQEKWLECPWRPPPSLWGPALWGPPQASFGEFFLVPSCQQTSTWCVLLFKLDQIIIRVSIPCLKSSPDQYFGPNRSRSNEESQVRLTCDQEDHFSGSGRGAHEQLVPGGNRVISLSCASGTSVFLSPQCNTTCHTMWNNATHWVPHLFSATRTMAGSVSAWHHWHTQEWCPTFSAFTGHPCANVGHTTTQHHWQEKTHFVVRN